MGEGTLRIGTMAAAVVVHLGLALVVGAIASQAWSWRRTSGWRDAAVGQALAMRRLGFVLGLVGVIAALWFEAAIMTGQPLMQAGPAIWTLLSHSHFGHAALVGIVVWLAAAALLVPQASRRDEPVRFALSLGAVAVFIATRSVVSHAASHGDVTLDVAVDWLHLLLVCTWVGIVVAGARLALPRAGASTVERAAATHWVMRMSTTATIALVGIVATGLYKLWRVFEPAAPLLQWLDSDYGRALAVKLVLVGVAAVLGGVNRFVVLPRLFAELAGADDDGRWRRGLVRILRFEAVTLVLVLIAAAVLGNTEPPGDG
ncbi:MAG: CopD family protein [Burkholderiales bacterium]|jgi:putative copper resistance protein D|nr:CopD family protein [Burkholderiales bacterium]